MHPWFTLLGVVALTFSGLVSATATTKSVPTYTCFGLTANKVGTSGADTIYYDPTRVQIAVGLGGGDQFQPDADGRVDYNCGNDGNDFFGTSSETAGERYHGDYGADTIYGSGVHDVIDSGPDADYINALGGDDTIYANSGNDANVFGGLGNDTIDGGTGTDHCYGYIPGQPPQGGDTYVNCEFINGKAVANH